MSIQYDGKSPGKFWYFMQKTKALMRTPFEYTTRNDAKKAGKDVGYFVAAAAVTSAIISVPLIAALPLVPTLLSLVGFSVALNYGWQGFQKLRMLSKCSFVYGYVREKENQWLHNKADGNFLQRGLKSIKEKVAGFGAKIPLPLVKAGKWLGISAAVGGAIAAVGAGLSYAGVPAFSTGVAATSILGGIAQAGAVIGLSAAAAVGTLTGLAIAAVPLGILAAGWCRKTAYARDPDRPVFKKTPPPGAPPIDRGQVFSPKAAAFEFNDNSATATPVSDDLSAERKKLAEQRVANRNKRGGGSRFN